MEFTINTTWNGKKVEHSGINITLAKNARGIQITIDSPFFNDPPGPRGEAGKPFKKLWEYEVVEIFFLNSNGQYIEIELCPHGQHLVLLLNGCRQCFKDELPVKYTAKICGDRWKGEVEIPSEYYPRNITKLNAYAIHGSGSEREYEALFATPTGKFERPDFHRLEYFKDIDFDQLIPSNHTSSYKSLLWDSL